MSGNTSTPRLSRGKIALLILTIGLLAYVVYLGALSYSGYCFEQRRYLSDQEKIEIVVNRILVNYVHHFESQKSLKSDRLHSQPLSGKPVPYRDMQHFFELNPDCCRVVMRLTSDDGETFSVGFWDRLTGSISSLVSVKYQIRFVDDAGKARARIEVRNQAMTNCGHPWSGI